MFFRQYYLGCLSHASYLIGDTTTGRAVVVDPQRDVAEYLADAEAHGLTIVKVLETHFHADFLSGHLELAARTGATIGYGRAADGPRRVPDRDCTATEIESTWATSSWRSARPRGTRRSRSASWSTRSGDSPRPYGVLTGDTLFIGDVGRPDLLASVGVTAEELARQLYHSLHERLLDAAGRHQGVPGPRRRLGVREEPVDRDGVHDRRAASHQLRARADERGRLRRSRHAGSVRRAALLLVRREPQP